MAARKLHYAAALLEPLARVLSGRLQQTIACLVSGEICDDQRLIDERCQQIEDVAFLDSVAGTDRHSRVEREAPRKQCKALEQQAGLCGKQVIAPIDRRAHRLVTRQDRLVAARQHAKDAVETPCKLVRRKHGDARRRKLDRER